MEAQHDPYDAYRRAALEASLEEYRAVIQVGQVALKTSLLINGGAAVALLAFLGRIWETHPSGPVVSDITSSLLWFVFGVFLAAVASAIAYLTLFAYGHKWITAGNIFLFITIILVTISLFSFVFGGYRAYGAFLTHLQPPKA